MENSSQQPTENLEVVKFDPAVVYAGASNLMLSESESSKLSAPFEDLDYEIRPDGYIYLPQVHGVMRLNSVIGPGRWGLLQINNGKEDLGGKRWKVFYDGAMVIRNCFVSRSVGEAQYNQTNSNQSWASALESAKTDCRQRCCKDIGIGTDAWNPSFIRRWQKEYAVRVFVEETIDGKKQRKPVWRRKDLEPFWNEIGPVPTSPTVEQKENKPIRAVPDEWFKKIVDTDDLKELTALYNENQNEVDGWPELKHVFTMYRNYMDRKKRVVV